MRKLSNTENPIKAGCFNIYEQIDFMLRERSSTKGKDCSPESKPVNASKYFNSFNFNTRNKCLIAKLLKQGYRYHKLRKAFSKTMN